MKSYITIIIFFSLSAFQLTYSQLNNLKGYWVGINNGDTITLEIKDFGGDSLVSLGILKKSRNNYSGDVLYINFSNDTLRCIDPYGNIIHESTDYTIHEDSFQLKFLGDAFFERVNKREYRKTTKLLQPKPRSRSDKVNEKINQKDY